MIPLTIRSLLASKHVNKASREKGSRREVGRGLHTRTMEQIGKLHSKVT
jgi:hypothetical protein